MKDHSETKKAIRSTSLESISVFGLGRVGLVTAVCLAKKGYSVTGVDPDSDRMELIRNAESPFFEPQLKEYITQGVKRGLFSVTPDSSINAGADLTFVTVGTPSERDGRVDLTYVKNAARAIGQSLRNRDKYQLVVIKSTVIPGIARKIVKPVIERLSRKKAGRDFGLCSNPEFLREGNAIHDTECPDRIVIGSEDPEATKKLESFYFRFHEGNAPRIIRTSHENAELMKYANNAYLATKVSFINCIANIAELVPAADVNIIANGIGLDSRIGTQFLNAGLGWGGSCLPKDLEALLMFSRALGYNPEVISAAVHINQRQWQKAIQLAKLALRSLKRKKVAVLGLAFKPNTDDMREAVSIPIIRDLLRHGAVVTAYDPVATETAREIFKDTITYAASPAECINQADCCIVTTEWDEFKTIPPSSFIKRMRRPIIVDGRRVYDIAEFSRRGIRLLTIGLGPTE